MKRLITLLLCFVLPLSSLAGATEHPELPEAVQKLCRDHYPDHEISSASGFGDNSAGQYALVLMKEEQRLLLIVEKGKEEPGYRITVDNAKAIKPGSRASTLIDTGGDGLFLSFEDGQLHWSIHAVKKGGGWGSIDAAVWDLSYRPSGYAWHFVEEHGQLHSTEEWADENDNIERLTAYPPFPAPHLAGRLQLDSYDWSLLPVSAKDYFMQHGAHLLATVQALQPEGWQHHSAAITPLGIFLLGSDAAGERRIHIHNWQCNAADTALVKTGVTVSAPVPEHVSMDAYHMGSGLILRAGGEAQVYGFSRQPDGTWRLASVQGEHSFGVGPGYLHDREAPGLRALIYGDHPAWTLDGADLYKLPKDLAEARAQLDQSGWAVVHNPNPADRLHLRSQPDRAAKSLGKYYNGTPVRVLARQGNWVQVDIRGVQGYMLASFLAFGDQMNGVSPAFPQLAFKEGITLHVYDQPNEQAPSRPVQGMNDSRVLILGLVGDTWYHVYDYGSGVSGYMPQAWFWEGNG